LSPAISLSRIRARHPHRHIEYELGIKGAPHHNTYSVERIRARDSIYLSSHRKVDGIYPVAGSSWVRSGRLKSFGTEQMPRKRRRKVVHKVQARSTGSGRWPRQGQRGVLDKDGAKPSADITGASVSADSA